MKTLLLGALLGAGLAATPAFADNSNSPATLSAAPVEVAQVYYYDGPYRHRYWDRDHHHRHRVWRHHHWDWDD